jgi:hypothetical protein
LLYQISDDNCFLKLNDKKYQFGLKRIHINLTTKAMFNFLICAYFLNWHFVPTLPGRLQ